MLYLICTPIGNLNDLSLRSINTLNEVDRIYVEDTRVAAKLLQHFKISKKTIPFHEHNEDFVISEIIEFIEGGNNVAIMSDAGAPLISDPGYPLIQQCIEKNIPFTALPGPSSVINALMLSGLPSDKFLFNGFLPKQNVAKRKIAAELKASGVTNIFFESAKRISKTIDLFLEVLDHSTEISICREMTKEYESIYRGTLGEVFKMLQAGQIKLLGEFVLLVYSEDNQHHDFKLDENFCRLFLEHLSPSDASKLIAKITSNSKKDVYKFLLDISK